MRLQDLKPELRKEFWSTHEIELFTGLAPTTIAHHVQTKTFPDPAFVLGSRMRAWNRTHVIDWYANHQARKAG